MPEIKIEIKPPLSDLASALKGINLSGALQSTIEKFAFSIERASKQVTPVKTGLLRGSILAEIKPLWAMISPHTNYAAFIHEGTSRIQARPFMTWGLEATYSKYGYDTSELFSEVKEKMDAVFKETGTSRKSNISDLMKEYGAK